MKTAPVLLLSLCLPALALADECSADNPESFDAFLPNFSQSRTFAIARTRLPLAIVRWAEGFDTDGKKLPAPQRYQLTLREYFQWPTLDEYVLNYGLQAKVGERSDTAVTLDVFKSGVDSRVAYHFQSAAGCWFLTQYEDRPG